jgi:SAM-dependent methyltransferase
MEAQYAEFSDPRLVALYDTINPLGKDGEFFSRLAEQLSARTIIDLGCGTGLLTCELAKRGHGMIGIEPSAAMLAVARAKPYADQVRWIQGSFEQMDGLQADMVLMTSHVAQFFLDENEWRAMVRAAHKALNGGGHLIFDVRRLSNPPFVGWPTENNPRKVENNAAGSVEWWFKLLSVENKRVRYALHYFLARSGEKIVSVNELAFRSQDEITEALSDAGFEAKTIYGDWDGSSATQTSPEMIFVSNPKQWLCTSAPRLA